MVPRPVAGTPLRCLPRGAWWWPNVGGWPRTVLGGSAEGWWRSGRRGDGMTYTYRKGAVVTYMREDGQPGPGESKVYEASDGWTVQIQLEGCVEIANCVPRTPAPRTVIPWNRIWRITSV